MGRKRPNGNGHSHRNGGAARRAERLQTLLGPWEATLRARSPHTARSYGEAVTRFLGASGGRLDAASIGSYLDSLNGLAASSRAHHVSAVRSFLRFCKEQGALEHAASDLLVRPRVAVVSFNRYLDLGELRRLVVAARELSPRHFAAVMLMAGTGLRVAEAASMQWRDLFHDPEGRLGLRVMGKGSKERVVKVRDDVFSTLVALHGDDALDARDTAPLLVDSRGTAYSTRGLHKLVAQAAAKADLDKPVSPHWLRHSHATLAALGGASAFTIQASLGHTRLETSQRYVHWARGLAETTADSLPELT